VQGQDGQHGRAESGKNGGDFLAVKRPLIYDDRNGIVKAAVRRIAPIDI
jgi:hypothetical protein